LKIIYTDALIIGGGLAGLRSAIAAKKKGLDTVLISMVPVRRSHSAAAQGGMQASLGNGKMSEGDNEDVHFSDTVKGSDWGCDQEVARMFVQTAPKAIRELAHWGVPWTRIRAGERTAIINTKKTIIKEDAHNEGLIQSRDFGGTKKWRTCYTADATGHTMLYAVANEANRLNVYMTHRKEAVSLITKDDQCCGAVVRDLITGKLGAYIAKGTMIATGGYGRIFKVSTNAVICKGTGAAIALETGIARLGNMEAIQFHPTPLFPSGILLTEGCRGDGGVLRDKDGYRFMPDYEPDKKDLASRDVVSRRMMEHIAKGKGVKSPYGEHLWLDISILGREHIEKNLRDVADISKTFAGIDPATGWMPVLPMQHYSMGGIRVKPNGESPTLKGLFCAGEAACWDLHGFNRLGGNSVSEAVVAGMIIGESFAEYCLGANITIDTDLINQKLQEQQTYLESLLKLNGTQSIFAIKTKMQEIMSAKVGIFRNAKDLQSAVDELQELYRECKNITIKNKKLHGNVELDDAYRVPRMIKIALCAAVGALQRCESRGAHTRTDYPKRDDANFLNRTLTYWKHPDDPLPTVEYEELDVMKMEIAPGFRGYGDKDNIIEHPGAAKRAEEITRITDELTAKHADRFTIQNALMPYELSPKYKAKNQRVGVGYE